MSVQNGVVNDPRRNPAGNNELPAKQKEVYDLPIKKFLPFTAFFAAFFFCMTLLLVYMDNTAMRHHQFKVNMTQDYELSGVAQDDRQLILYIRQVHLTTAVEPHHPPIETHLFEPSPVVAFVLKLFNQKREGFFVEAGAYSDGKTSETVWFEKRLAWKGLLIQPDPRQFFKLRRHNRTKSWAIHACLSPTSYPKEITFHREEKDGVKINGVRVNSVDDSEWFNTRVKCFPLYSLLLAVNKTSVDCFQLEAEGAELQVLETIPFEKVDIEIINVNLSGNESEHESVKEFLAVKNYVFLRNFESYYVFMKKNR